MVCHFTKQQALSNANTQLISSELINSDGLLNLRGSAVPPSHRISSRKGSIFIQSDYFLLPITQTQKKAWSIYIVNAYSQTFCIYILFSIYSCTIIINHNCVWQIFSEKG